MPRRYLKQKANFSKSGGKSKVWGTQALILSTAITPGTC